MLNYKYFSTTSHYDGSLVWRCIICGYDFDTEEMVKQHQVIDHLSEITKEESQLPDTAEPVLDNTKTPDDIQHIFANDVVEAPESKVEDFMQNAFDSKEVKEKSRPETYCSFFECYKTATNYCEYCRQYFCDEHSSPALVDRPKFDSKGDEYHLLRWNAKGGHPCVPFSFSVTDGIPTHVDHTDLKMKEKEREHQEVLEKTRIEEEKQYEERKRSHEESKESYDKSHPEKHVKSKVIATSLIIAVIVGGLIALSNGMPASILASFNVTSTATSTTHNPLNITTSTATQTPVKNATSPLWADELLANLTHTTRTTSTQNMTTKTTSAQIIKTQTITTQTSTISTTRESTTTKSTTSLTTIKPVSPSSQPSINITELELEIHNHINVERQSNGLRALVFDPKLLDIARNHSKDMALNNYFSHVNLQGQDPTARAKAQGYSTYKNFGAYYTDGIAENILQNNLYDSITYINGIPIYNWNTQSEIAQSSVQLWMNSAGHRQNILNRDYDKEGIGIAISSDGKVYVTEDFW